MAEQTIELYITQLKPEFVRGVPVFDGRQPPCLGDVLPIVSSYQNPQGRRKKWTGKVIRVYQDFGKTLYDLKVIR